MFEDVIAKLETIAGTIVDHTGWLSRDANHLAINAIVGATRNRPHPWSTVSDYTSWEGLTDTTYLARHLPACDPPAPPARAQPTVGALMALFKRPPGGQTLSNKSTCLFPAFAQYLTDGFIRTDQKDRRKTTSNHQIDLCPLYGRKLTQTNILREHSATEGRRGRLKSQMIDGEEFAPYLYTRDGLNIAPPYDDPEFDQPLGATLATGAPAPVAPERLATLFAFGGDRANSTPFAAMMNTLLLREHNRVAATLEHMNPGWDDEHVFQVARNILIPIYIKIVVEQYINHITPLPFRLSADPSVAWSANWNRPNWMTAEFSLLYRWHSLMPDTIAWKGRAAIPLADFGLDNTPLIAGGLDAAFSTAAAQPTAELGAMNTADALLMIEELAIMQARTNRIAPYNAYRVAFGMPPAKAFDDITHRADVKAILEALYDSPDDLEFYPGLFAEDRVKNSPLPTLLMHMVAVDAFSQALTNPLLSEHVFNAQTFTPWGFELIANTSSLEDLLARNVSQRGPQPIVMTQASWRFS
jgi:prostaglandin-endoperoxide synthase 2